MLISFVASGVVNQNSRMQKPKPHIIQLFEQIQHKIDSNALSELLPGVLRLARGLGATDLEDWTRLELDGYVSGNPAMSENVIVPEYRSVPGQYYDDFGNRLVVENRDLHFIFEDRVRFGVAEIEQLSKRQDEIRVIRTPGIEMVRKHLEVPVTTYGFPPSALSGVLGAIRSELVTRLADAEHKFDIPRTAGIPIARPESTGVLAWVARHIWPIVGTIGGGLLVAYLSHVLGWV